MKRKNLDRDWRISPRVQKNFCVEWIMVLEEKNGFGGWGAIGGPPLRENNMKDKRWSAASERTRCLKRCIQ